MAKETPNKPEETKGKPVIEKQEQTVPAIKPVTEKTVKTEQPAKTADKPPAAKPEQTVRAVSPQKPAADEVVISADKINELAGKQKAADKASREKTPPAGEADKKAVQPEIKESVPKATKAEKPKIEPPVKPPVKPDDKVIPLRPADSEEKLRREQEALLKALDEKAEAIAKKSPPVKSSNPALEAQKQKLEKELREKYGIPKTDQPVKPWVAPETEKVVRIPHEQLHAFKSHTFNVEKNAKFNAFVASIRAHGVTQPVIVRPDGKDRYEIISGHRRDLGSIEAGIPYSPCIIRELNDDQAIQQMVEDNVNNREITTMELARSLKVQLDSIKRQGAREELERKNLSSETDTKIGKRSNEIIAERNGMSVKQVQRHIALTNLTPAMQAYVDGKPTADGKKVIQIGFVPAFELSYLKPENQDYIAVAIEGQQSTPSLSQAQRLRDLDKKGLLNPDMIDGVLMEEKKEADKVILSTQELSEYFGKAATAREMKDTILKLLGEWKSQQKDISTPEKKTKQPEK